VDFQPSRAGRAISARAEEERHALTKTKGSVGEAIFAACHSLEKFVGAVRQGAQDSSTPSS